MLEHVAAGQTRFVAPGLSADARGIVVGRFVCVLLPSIDRVVGFLRGFSQQASLDELLPSLEIAQVRTPLSSREFVLKMAAGSSYAADGIAAVAYLVGGLVFTGTTKHFVKFRDKRSPLGYDVDKLQAAQGDYVLYGQDFEQPYQRESVLRFDRLVLSLSLLRITADTPDTPEQVMLRVPRGLYPPVLAYLHRNGVKCGAAAVEVSGVPGAAPGRAFLLRCEQLPPRMITLFRAMPGIEVYRHRAGGVAVQLGYEHPIELDSCSSIFRDEVLHLFSGERDAVDEIDPAPRFVDARALVRFESGEGPRRVKVESALPEKVAVPLQLVPLTGSRPRLVASRVPLDEGPKLRQLIYLLPRSVLDRYAICFSGQYAYLFCEEGIDYVPLGELYWQIAAGVFVQQGYTLLPSVAPEVLLPHLESDGADFFFFGAGDIQPVRFSRSDFQPLGKRTLAAVELHLPPPVRGDAIAVDQEVTLVNDDLGAFPLWGFDGRQPEDE